MLKPNARTHARHAHHAHHSVRMARIAWAGTILLCPPRRDSLSPDMLTQECPRDQVQLTTRRGRVGARERARAARESACSMISLDAKRSYSFQYFLPFTFLSRSDHELLFFPFLSGELSACTCWISGGGDSPSLARHNPAHAARGPYPKHRDPTLLLRHENSVAQRRASSEGVPPQTT